MGSRQRDRIGIFLPNWIGDVAMATPALRAIRTTFSDARLVGFHKPYVAEVLGGTNWLDEMIPFHPKSKNKSLGSLSVIKRMRKMKLDTAILMTNSLRTAAIAWLGGARERIGYVRYGRGPLLSNRLHPPRNGRKLVPISAVDYCLSLAYAAGCPTEERRMQLAVQDTDHAIADDVWKQLELDDGSNVVVLNTGGAYGAAKNWPEEYFAELARRIVDELGAMVLVICGPAERETVARIEAAANHPRVRSLAEIDVSIGPLKACLDRVGLVVSTDSGPRHLAVALDTKVVSLVGSIDPGWSTTYHSLETRLQHKVDCGPCGKRICPLEHHRCMRDLTVERVFAEVRRRWSDNQLRVA